MRKLFTVFACLMALLVIDNVANAQEVHRVAKPSFIAGGGVNANMYDTESQLESYSPSMFYGLGLPTASSFLGGIMPDETYLVGQFVRTKIKGVDDHIGTYTASVAGIWYLDDSFNFWQPFLMARTNLDNVVDTSGSALAYLNGQLGLGLGVPISSRSSVFAVASVKLGEDVNADLAAGLRVNF